MAEIATGTLIAGNYRLVHEISRGGMGSVWLGRHLHLEIPIAIKFMRASLVEDSNARSRFEREAKAAALIRSPHVVHIYDHGVDDGVPFIVMEHLEGEDLRRRLRGRRRLTPAVAVRVCKEVCKGLHRAHERGIVHRDLKPGNIWLSAPDDDTVKLLDFGIAKETGEHRMVHGETTTSGQLLGSPHYMSPEQARGHDLDGRSDLWSLAVIMYRALTGRRPFDGDDIGDLIVRVCMDPIPPASLHAPFLERRGDAFFARAFERDPENRFQTAREFAAAFETALAGVTELGTADAAAWDHIAGGPSESDTPSHMTSSSGSSRFGNMVGPVPPSQPELTVGGDTFAATASPRRKRRRLVGGMIAAALATLGAVAVLATSGEEPAAQRGPASAGEAPVTRSSSETQTSRTTPSSQEPQAPSATALPSAKAPATKPRPFARRPPVRRPPARRPPVRQPPAPAPAPKVKDPLGY